MLRPDVEGADAPVASDADAARHAAAMQALDTVLDPELDEPVTTMGFIEALHVGSREIEVVFRLPTFWCSANFAFLMATDMRHALEQLPFVEKATIRLVDHFAARKINRGVAEGLGFAAVFAGEADTDLDALRRTFRERAVLGRQERLLRLLVSRWSVEAALATTMADLHGLTGHDDGEIRGAALRYLAMRRHEADTAPLAPAFVTTAGLPVTAATYTQHLRAIRGVRGAAEANAEMCRLLLEARLAHPAPGCTPEDRQDDQSHDDAGPD